ncbi:DUF647 family protein [Gorgonomyces haynaldii]|nr:DUF647 family protein [Gorgonomyces haynaldii]
MIQVFLPQDYPHSVSPDYLNYQIYDTLQALCSSVNGLFARRASLKRAGVGDATASVTNATLQWVLSDGTAMIGRILFAYGYSFDLDADLKLYRFMADIFNDFGMLLDMLAPLFPKEMSWMIICVSSLSFSLCGVCGGSTKAALSQHFAIRNNVADLNAKDGSQETLVQLVGIVLGSTVLQRVSDDDLVLSWIIFIGLTLLHLYFNYRAVKSVHLRTLNDQRLWIVMQSFLESGSVLDPVAVSKKEHFLWQNPIKLGVPLASILKDQEKPDSDRHCVISRHSLKMAITDNSNQELFKSYVLGCLLLSKKDPSDLDSFLDKLKTGLQDKGWDLQEYSLRISHQGWIYKTFE